MDPVRRIRSTLEMKFITDKDFDTRPPYFKFQVDFRVNLTVRRVHESQCDPTNVVQCCFDMSAYSDPASEPRFSDILKLVGTPPNYLPVFTRRLIQQGRAVAESYRHVDFGWAHIVVNVAIDYYSGDGVLLSGPDLERAQVEDAAVRRPLKRVRMEATTTMTTCSICFEDVEAFGTSTPCSHVFHDDCIAKWLKISPHCPLCRFKIPIPTQLS